MLKLDLNVTGFEYSITVTDKALKNIYVPVVERMTGIIDGGAMPIVYAAGTPGAGKSTFSAVICEIMKRQGYEISALSIDGFHYTNAYLDTHFMPDGSSLRAIKGAPQTYDVDALKHALSRLGHEKCIWPRYDRKLHEPVPDVAPLAKDAFIIEGNWLLLNGYGWDLPAPCCGFTLFLDAPDDVLFERLVARKLRGGLSRKEAEAFCARSDMSNVELCRKHSKHADIYINY